jgi:hypothetical protein
MSRSERDPLTRQRSPWRQGEPILVVNVRGDTYEREAGDGRLIAIVTEEPAGWHLSISHRRDTRRGPIHVRYPRWDEIADARDRFLPPDRPFIMLLPAAGDYVAEHKTTMHLHELTVDLARHALDRSEVMGGPNPQEGQET